MSKRRQPLTPPPGLEGLPPEHWPGSWVRDEEGGDLRADTEAAPAPLALPAATDPAPAPEANP